MGEGAIQCGRGRVEREMLSQPPVCCYIPSPSNENLVQRSDIADTLTKILPTPAALSGLGGSE
ncbi:hypothetical protein PG984_000021 [Apiospora sp. TS-2023a]